MSGGVKFRKVAGIVLAVLSLFALPLVSVWKKSKTAELLKEVETLGAHARTMRLQNLALRGQRNRLLSRERVEAAAMKGMGMVYPAVADVVVLERIPSHFPSSSESGEGGGE